MQRRERGLPCLLSAAAGLQSLMREINSGRVTLERKTLAKLEHLINTAEQAIDILEGESRRSALIQLVDTLHKLILVLENSETRINDKKHKIEEMRSKIISLLPSVEQIISHQYGLVASFLFPWKLTGSPSLLLGARGRFPAWFLL